MSHWYCPDCFAEVAPAAAQCPRCGADLSALGGDFEQRLIKALRHPLPDRQLLAAQILGARRAHQAVPRLMEVIQESNDPYLAAEAVTALARIGDPAGLAVVDRIARDGPAVPRAAARAALRRRRGVATEPGEPPLKTVFLIRHGRTALNATGMLRGRVDVPLDEVGQQQAARLGALFAPVELAALVCSPLRRARQTAAPIAASTGAAVEVDPAFTDRDVGAWSGTATAEVIRRFGALDEAAGVERREDFERRLLAGWRHVTAGPARKPLAIVTHDAVIGCLLETIVSGGVPPERAVRLPTGCWSRLERRDGRWSAAVVGAVPDDGARPDQHHPEHT